MARATLVHNPTAGDGEHDGESLMRWIRRHGPTPRYVSTDDDLDRGLDDPGDLVVVVGGDGTVGKVASRLIGQGVPLLILPFGTANNVAQGLGVPPDPDLRRHEGDWLRSPTRRLDVGIARGPWGTRHFVESFGIGAFARAMPILSALKKGPDQPDGPQEELQHDRLALVALIEASRPFDIETPHGLEGTDDVILTEAMNMPTAGPNLTFAPDADPSDGRLDLVTLHADDRDSAVEWVRGESQAPPRFRHTPIAEFRFLWNGQPLHIDGRPWGSPDAPFKKTRTAEADGGGDVHVGIEPEGVPVIMVGD